MRRSVLLVTAVALALALGAACSRALSDSALANEIKAKMFSEAQLKTAALQVTAKDGEVTLAGEVPGDSARYLAFRLAAETVGVRKVNDQMRVQAAEMVPPQPVAAPEPAPVRKPLARAAPARKAAARPVAQPLDPPPPPAPESAAETASAPPPPAPKAPEPVHVVIPARTSLSVSLIDSINSEVNHTGEEFAASLDHPIVVDGEIVVPAGTDVWIKLVHARSAGHMSGRSELRLELSRMEFQGKRYSLSSNAYEQLGTARGKRTAATIGGGAAIGAAIGAIAGGGKGAAIGGAIGAGTGTAVQAATKGQQIKLEPETRLDFRLDQPVEITYFPEKNKSRR